MRRQGKRRKHAFFYLPGKFTGLRVPGHRVKEIGFGIRIDGGLKRKFSFVKVGIEMSLQVADVI